MTLVNPFNNTNKFSTFQYWFAALLFFAFVLNGTAQSIWSNPITGTDPGMTNPYTTGQTLDANISVSGITRFTGLTANSGNDRFNAKGWTTGNSLAIDDYFEFILTPNAGYRIDFVSFEYHGKKSANGPVSFVLLSSADGFVTPIGTPNANGTTVSLSAAIFQGRTVATTFRFYGYNAVAGTGTFGIEDFTFNGNVNATCASVTLTSVTPNNGPVGTEITINAVSGLTGATATFGGVAAPIVTTTATQLVVTVPAGAITGNLIVKNAALCASAARPFTVINQDLTTCAGSTLPTELFISEVTDSSYGSLSYIEIYNGTGSTKTLSSYSIKIASNGVAAYLPGNSFVLPNVSLTSGSTYVIAIGTGSGFDCTSTPGGDGSYADFTAAIGVTSVNFPSNGDDHIGLFSGATLIDSWGIYGNSSWAPATIGNEGATFRRNNTATPLPNPTYSNANWTIINFPGSGASSCSGNDYSDIGSYAIFASPPTVTTNPTASVSCTTTNISLTVAGDQGVAAAPGLAYQWYSLAPGSSTWVALTNVGVYTGATAPTLNISSIAALNNYQFYCQIREDTATCFKASNATIIKDIYGTTWASGSWSNGLPSITKRVIIDDVYDTAVNTPGSFSACSLTVNSGVGRSLTISPNTYVIVENQVTNNGTFTVEDDGSLIQNNNASVNFGSIAVKREVSMKKYDYVYWSAPVGGFPVTSVSSGTTANFIYDWLPTQGGTTFGIWHNINENMLRGKGYIIRSPSVWPAAATPFTTSFNGIPNNGIINRSIARGGQQGIPYDNGNSIMVTRNDDNWNLVGNPYPSAINSKAFLDANSNIEGAIRLWTHGNLPAPSPLLDPFYGNFLYNYNSNDYIVWNGTASISGPVNTFTGNIASGQGFFVLMNDGLEDYSQSVIFNNGMRTTAAGLALNNDQFYRPGVEAANNDSDGFTDKSRIWLDLIGATGVVNRTVVGYVDGATVAKDRMFDAFGKLDSNQNFYSLIDDQIMAIQGRPLPIDTADRIPLGMHVNSAGNYKIAIFAADGYFTDSATPIYLEDRTLGIIHDLRQAPYDFTSANGTFDSRFILRYTNQTLGDSAFSTATGQVVVAVKNQQISIKSFMEPIQEVNGYDLLGRKVTSKQSVNANELIINDLAIRNQPLIVKIRLQNGQSVTQKILF